MEDVIPGYGPEEFRELDRSGRRFTYGVCAYAGGVSNVALTVNDPNGAGRTSQHRLAYTGDSAILATSPDGPGYVPESGWCRHNEDE